MILGLNLNFFHYQDYPILEKALNGLLMINIFLILLYWLFTVYGYIVLKKKNLIIKHRKKKKPADKVIH